MATLGVRIEPPFGDSTGQDNNAQDLEWSSPDQVAAHVSKTTLAGMQTMWRAHATTMDTKGREFAEKVFSLHSEAIREIANLRSFELKPVLAVLNSFTAGVRERVLQIFQDVREADDAFAQGLFQTSRRAFSRNLREALEAKDVVIAEKVRHLKAVHEAALEQQRAAAAEQLVQAHTMFRSQVVRELKDENKIKLAEAVAAITAQLTQHFTMQAALEREVNLADSPSPSLIGSATRSMTQGTAAPTRPGTARLSLNSGEQTAAVQAVAGLAHLTSLELGFGGQDGSSAAPSFSLEMLKALTLQDEDANVGAVLVRKEMEAAMRVERAGREELQLKVDELAALLRHEQQEMATWQEKWTSEKMASDSMRKECLQIILKCEGRVTSLQHEHVSELTLRDDVLQRAKDTIIRLERKVAEISGKPDHSPRLVSSTHLSFDLPLPTTLGSHQPGTKELLPLQPLVLNQSGPRHSGEL